MALYYSLPIYKSSYDLVLLLFKTTQNFSREYKYTVGQALQNKGLEIIECVYNANKSHDKYDILEKARGHVEMIRTYIRLMHDFKQIGLKRFVALQEYIEDVSKQLSAWSSYSKSPAQQELVL